VETVYAHVIINMGMPRVHTFEPKSRLLQLRVLTIRAIDISFSLFVSIHPYQLI